MLLLFQITTTVAVRATTSRLTPRRTGRSSRPTPGWTSSRNSAWGEWNRASSTISVREREAGPSREWLAGCWRDSTTRRSTASRAGGSVPGCACWRRSSPAGPLSTTETTGAASSAGTTGELSQRPSDSELGESKSECRAEVVSFLFLRNGEHCHKYWINDCTNLWLFQSGGNAN